MANLLAQQGYDLALAADRDLDAARTSVTANGGTAVLEENADFSDEQRIDEFYERVRELLDLRSMREAGSGRILITSSTASQTPGPWAAAYFAFEAALESFGQSRRVENKDTGVSLTLLPGATATEFFERPRSTDTKGAVGPMDHPLRWRVLDMRRC